MFLGGRCYLVPALKAVNARKTYRPVRVASRRGMAGSQQPVFLRGGAAGDGGGEGVQLGRAEKRPAGGRRPVGIGGSPTNPWGREGV